MNPLALQSALLGLWEQHTNEINLLKPKLDNIGLCIAGYIACKLVFGLISVIFGVTESTFFILIEERFSLA